MRGLNEIVGAKGIALLDYRRELVTQADADRELIGEIDQAFAKIYELLYRIQKDPIREVFYLSDIDSLLNPFFASQQELNRSPLPQNETDAVQPGKENDKPKANPLKEFKNRMILWGQDKAAGGIAFDGDTGLINCPDSELKVDQACLPRYLAGDFPNRVVNGETAWLHVYISTVRTRISALIKDLDVPKDGLTLEIFVYASCFDVLGEPSAPIRLMPKGNSTAAAFQLRAKEAVSQSAIKVQAFNGPTLVGALEIFVDVVDALDHGSQPQTLHKLDGDTQPQHGSSSLLGSLEQLPGDVSLQLYRSSNSSREWTFIWRDKDGVQPPARPDNPLSELEDVVDRSVVQIEDIVNSNYKFDQQTAIDYIKDEGSRLWNDLIPRVVRKLIIEKRKDIKRIIIYSDSDPIPWEMLYLFEDNEDFGFLVENVDICRWTFGSKPPLTIPVHRADFVVPNDLEHADDEKKRLKEKLRGWYHALEVDDIETARELFDLFKTDRINVLHFACHNALDKKIACIKVNTVPITPHNFFRYKQKAKSLQAFIFLNACHSDVKPAQYTRIGGWANCFLDVGAGAFIGTSWEVRDETAALFAEELYTALLTGAAFGQALRIARKAVQEKTKGADPTWLAYSFYGDTNARLEKRIPVKIV